ncbi:GHMP kinase [Roseibacterium sp. SDUM158017]|uniref:GHMP family kinase ATP-binding protein n=1 Tax=Roseicyclus salinarum TaxID=3036773 RepID=UPI0024157A11|nr:GHMP kinase [Roseibacterium sp. SDUM158017]MDG4649613.1 GHMP kinase [Roseibacterium sp. SDUM158017]
MIITQTPYRVSFAGGGTDLPAFYEHEAGAVLSVAVNHHMYVTVSPRFDKTTRVAYTRVEIADGIDRIEHTIAREALRMTGLGEHLEITTVGDVPAGTGMGSSSSLAVGILNALYAYKGQVTSPGALAEKACEIEIDILKKPIGRQDQYAAAFGGVNYIRFNPDHSVDVEPVPTAPAFLDQLERHIILLYTDQQRDADTILKKQSEGSRDKMSVLREMRDLAGELRKTMGGQGNLEDFGRILHHGWELKRSLGFGISNQGVDDWYRAARANGAMGGKLLGAGGGGFLLIMAPPERHEAIREAVGRPREIKFSIDRRGSRVIYISDRYTF